MSSAPKPPSTPVLVIRESGDGTPHWEAKWRYDGRQIKRRVPGGPAWAERDASGAWHAATGRAGRGTITRDRAAVLASQLVDEVTAEIEAERAAKAAAAEEAPPLFRTVAAEWLDWLERVRGAKPATLRDYDCLLKQPGTPFKRGKGKAEGRIMAAFADRDMREVTAKEIEAFLRQLDRQGLTPRNVNKHRQLLSAIWNYACRPDTYRLERNVAAQTDKRREPLPAVLEYFEPHEVELLAQTMASGDWRTSTATFDDDEIAMQAEEDARDAELFRLLLYSGLRLGELRALRWGSVDLEGRALFVRSAFSAGKEVDPKGRARRWTPLATPAVEALTRHRSRSGGNFTTADDFVFCGRFGEPLDDSALRRRYKAAREKAGLRDVKLHGLRHAAGSIYARQAAAVEVRDFLGHAKLSTTDRYVSARMSEEALARLDAAFAARGPV
ncbi:MAG: tyrosine-type recombinase/integrase [Solirubrobacteraceae bacterium]|nr:tyrosine-type recombinase/integrase [Solirubrobacteraceae bacterium]